jgi:hypothetical protein
MKRTPSNRTNRRWIRMGNAGRYKLLRMRDQGLQWFPPARQKRWAPGAEVAA